MKTYEQLVKEMGKSEAHELESRIAVVIEHLLKIEHVKGQVGIDNRRGWKKSLYDQVVPLADLVDENPGLKPRIPDALMDKVYRSVAAYLKTDYPSVSFPRSRQLALDEIAGRELVAK